MDHDLSPTRALYPHPHGPKRLYGGDTVFTLKKTIDMGYPLGDSPKDYGAMRYGFIPGDPD
jgi:hypothetical protein